MPNDKPITTENWGAFGDYTGQDCPNCGRQRLMKCMDPKGDDRIICEKCNWEPMTNDYCKDYSNV